MHCRVYGLGVKVSDSQILAALPISKAPKSPIAVQIWLQVPVLVR